jgi:predicted HAD superfamily hydrolase
MVDLIQPKLIELVDRVRDPRYKVISFDVFDTLLRRPVVDPKHLFFYMGVILRERGLDSFSAIRFGEARIIAGARANHYGTLYGKEDVDLATIYDFLGSMFPNIQGIIPQIMQLELDLEDSFLEAYPLGVHLFQQALQAGKRIVLCSDQYLPKSFLARKLQDNDVAGYEHFFLSGELGALKVSGTVFDWLPMRLGVNRNEICHLGDNDVIDVRMPRSRGLAAEKIPQSIALADHPGIHSAAARHATLSSVAVARYMHLRSDAALIGGFPPHHDHLDFLGYAFYGPLLASVAHWLVRKLEAGEVDKIWILARDGEGLSKILPILYPEHASRFEYVYSSRRLLVYPGSDLTGNEVFRHFKHLLTDHVSAHSFLEQVSGQGADLSSFKPNFRSTDMMGNHFVQAKMSRCIDGFYVERRRAGSNWKPDSEIFEYYRSKIRGAKNIGVFDIGWRGNLQRSLEDILGTEGVKFKGLYIGQVYENELPKRLIDAEAFAFNLNYPQEIFDEIFPNIWPLELIFGGTELSAISIKKAGDDWCPGFEAETETNRRLRSIAEKLQNGAVRFTEDVCRWNRSLALSLASRANGITLLREFLHWPSWYDAKIFSDMEWTININEEIGSRFIVAPRGSSGSAIVRAATKSFWPAGFEATLTSKQRRKRDRYVNTRNRFFRLAQKNRYVWKAVCIVRDRVR